MAEQNTGKITQIIGAVMDIKFSQGKIPEINEAIRIPLETGGELTVEVAQDLGDDTVRCIAMGSTDGMRRGMDAIATGAPITVPVGENTLGRIFNVLGEPIDNKEKPHVEEYLPIQGDAVYEFRSDKVRPLLRQGPYRVQSVSGRWVLCVRSVLCTPSTARRCV